MLYCCSDWLHVQELRVWVRATLSLWSQFCRSWKWAQNQWTQPLPRRDLPRHPPVCMHQRQETKSPELRDDYYIVKVLKNWVLDFHEVECKYGWLHHHNAEICTAAGSLYSMFMSKKSTIKEISQKYLEKFYTNILLCKLINNRSHLPTPITPLCIE